MVAEYLFQNVSTTPIGSLSQAGTISGRHGPNTVRRLGRYALVYVLAGTTPYWDPVVGDRYLRPGDLFLLTPDLPHRYGGILHDPWEEYFLVFDGPIFACWRAEGLLEPAWWHLQPVEHWLGRLRACFEVPGRTGVDAALTQVCRLQQVLTDLRATTLEEQPAWLPQACALLADPAARHLDLTTIAHRLDVPAQRLRKTFTTVMGMPPAAWRRHRYIDEACRRLASGAVTGRQLAEDLGFADEYHFSRCFRRITGQTPTAFRARLAGR